MSGDSESDLSAIAWPGFVDILSAVIIMFVFFVLIIAVVLYFHVITYKAKVQTDAVNLAMEAVTELEIEDPKAAGAPPPTDDLVQQVITLQVRNEALEQTITDLKKLMQSHAEFSESENQTFEENVEEARFVVFFGIDTITLTEDSFKALESFVEKVSNRYNLSESRAVIYGGVDDNARQPTASKKLAVARMLNARNVLLKTDLPKDEISVKIDAGREIEEEFNWVEVVIEPK